MADPTTVPDPFLNDLFGDLDIIEPEPSVALIAAPTLLCRRILAALDYDRLPVIAHAETCDALLDGLTRCNPRVVVVAGLSEEPLLEAIEAASHSLPESRVVFVTEHLLGSPLRRALRIGACGAVAAPQIETGLALAVRAASAGMVVVPEAMRERLEPPALSPRERQVLALAAEGATSAEIASDLTVSIGTVKRHLSSCFAKLGVQNRSEALALLVDAEHHPAAASAR
ncbi:MAG TPA: response regulator transcription factor [Solirubrobacteraceae bacterium]